MKNEKSVGVITGDLINSSALGKEQKKLIESELECFVSNNPGVLLPLQFYRGDSFQLMVTKEHAAWTAVMIEAIVLSTASTLCRLGLGVGTVSKIAPGNVLQSEGEAFLLSGHQLDNMKGEGRIFKIALNNSQFQPILSATFHLAEVIIRGWKKGQARVVAQMPFASTQKEIANKLGISQAAVSKALKTSNWASVQDFLRGYEETVKMI